MVCFSLTVTSASAQDDSDAVVPRVEVTEVTKNIYKLACTDQFVSNCVALVGKDGILLIDAGVQQTAELLVEELEKLEKGPVTYLIMTHGHADHTGANALLGGEAKIIAHENFERAFKSGYGLLAELPENAFPDITFKDTHSLDFGGEKIELTYFAHGHSDSDIIIHFTNSKVACLGALYTPDNFPFVDLNRDGDVKKYSDNIKKMIGMFPDDVKLITSHGRDGTKADLVEFHKMLLKTTGIIQKGLDEGKDIEAMQKDDVLKEWDSWGAGFVSKNFWIQTVANSLTGNIPPQKTLVFEPLFHTVREKGATAAIEKYHELKKNHPEDYNFGENNLNALGYYLLGKEKYDEAIEIFKLNIVLFPESANPYDSLGEAYMNKGDKKLAIVYYEKALEINPEYPSAITALKQLKGE
jgi:glyoxylase-like metal-dependent hydrolase (beta-lactamase superfamily II)